MKLSKKLLACLLAALMVFSAAGCAGSSQAQTTAARRPQLHRKPRPLRSPSRRPPRRQKPAL